MLTLFRFVGRLLAAVAVLSSSSACTKSDTTPAPAVPTTGSLEGSYAPVAALRTVTATLPGTPPVTVTPGPGGVYTFRDLPAGTYTLTYAPAPGYRVPNARPVVVEAGRSTAVPLLTLTTEGSITFGYVGGSFTADAVSASLAGGELRLDASNAAASVSLQGFGVTGPGTFNLEQGFFNHGANRYRQNSRYAPGLRITSLNLTTRLVSGTFFFEADPYAGSGYTTGISGTFTDVVLP